MIARGGTDKRVKHALTQTHYPVRQPPRLRGPWFDDQIPRTPAKKGQPMLETAVRDQTAQRAALAQADTAPTRASASVPAE